MRYSTLRQDSILLEKKERSTVLNMKKKGVYAEIISELDQENCRFWVVPGYGRSYDWKQVKQQARKFFGAQGYKSPQERV